MDMELETKKRKETMEMGAEIQNKNKEVKIMKEPMGMEVESFEEDVKEFKIEIEKRRKEMKNEMDQLRARIQNILKENEARKQVKKEEEKPRLTEEQTRRYNLGLMMCKNTDIERQYLQIQQRKAQRKRYCLPDYDHEDKEDDDGIAATSKFDGTSKCKPKPNPNVRVAKHLELFLRSAEMAVQYLNQMEEDADFELVEILSGHHFFNPEALWGHFNFTAKPKVVDNGKSNKLSFCFAEIRVGYGKPDDPSTFGSTITKCSRLRKDSFGVCRWCNTKHKYILHPLNGFVDSK